MSPVSRVGAAELALRALGALGAAQVLLSGVLLGGLLLAATGPPRDDPYALPFVLGVAATAALGLLLMHVVPAARRWARPSRSSRPTVSTLRQGSPDLQAQQPVPAGA